MSRLILVKLQHHCLPHSHLRRGRPDPLYLDLL